MRGAHFAVHDFIRLSEKCPPLAVTEHHVTDEEIAQHRRADLTGERPGAFPMHILRTDLDVLRLTKRSVHNCYRGERRNEHDLHLGGLADLQEKRADEAGRLTLSHVHLPIRGDDFLTHGWDGGGSELKINKRRVARRNK